MNLNLLKLRLVDFIGGLSIYTVLKHLKEEQYMPKEELDKIREEKFNEQFTLARRTVPYYAAFNTYNDLPVLTKEVIRDHTDQFFSGTYKGKLIKKTTSGSTGTPLKFYTSARAQSYLWAALLLCWEATGYRFGGKVAFIAGNALIKKGIKHTIFYKLLNITLYPASVMSEEAIAGYVASIKKNRIKLIYGYATSINTIAEYILQNGITPPVGLCGIVSTAELLSDKMRANIEKAFGVKVYNQYGCNEAGVSAFECEHHQLHLISSRCKYDTDTSGNLITTDLANEAFVLIKYNTNDIVHFADKPCTCGRSYPVIKDLLGRADDVLTDRKHKTIHCHYFFCLFKGEESIRQYQILFDEKSISVFLTVDGQFGKKNYQHYMDSIKSDLDFENYELKINHQFESKKNLKHSFIIDKRKHTAT